MRDNTYRIILGAILLLALYVDVSVVIYVTVAIVLFEGITNMRVPKLVNRMLKKPEQVPNGKTVTRFNFEAERMFRLTVGGLIAATYPLGADSVVWFFPWFMGFAILGAGVSGICPALALFKWVGFK